MAAAVLNSQVFNDFLCSQFSAFSAFSAFSSSSWQRRSVSPPQRGAARPRTRAGRPRQLDLADLALAAADDTGSDAHLAEALGEEEMSDHCGGR